MCDINHARELRVQGRLSAAFFVPERNGALRQEIAAVLIRSLAYVAQPIIEAIALRNCKRRWRFRQFRLGSFEWKSTTVEEFDNNR
jgi:hypothetical protein